MTERPPRTRLQQSAYTGHVFRTSLRLAALEELQYRSHFFTYLLNAVISMGTAIAGLSIVFGATNDLNGWSSDELLVVVGVFFALSGVIMGVVHPSMAQLADDIKSGVFDFRLLKPVDAQLLSAIQKVDVWRSIDLVLGLALAGVGLARLDQGIGAGEVALHAGTAAALFLVGIAMVTGFWALVSSICFWTIQGQGVVWALDDMYDHVRWPLGIFPGPMRVMLSTIFPAGLAITVPAEALIGRLDLSFALYAVGMAGVMVGGSRIAWSKALGHYSSASS